MSFVHNMHIVGDIKESFALISVEYPSGSHCTCSNGTKTLTATDTSGSYVFPIPEAGSWTVRCWDGASYESSDNKASQIINIATQYQVEVCVLSYVLVLYDSGNQYTEITGGYNAYGAMSFTPTGIILGGGLAGCGMSNKTAINFTNYSVLIAYCSFSAVDYSGGYQFQFGLTSTRVTGSTSSEYSKFVSIVHPNINDTSIRVPIPDNFVGYIGSYNIASGKITKIEAI